MFDYDYPNFLPHIVIALEKHPQIDNATRDKLTTYCEMFDLHWKEDQTKLLKESPVYLKGSKSLRSDLFLGL